MPPPPVPRRPSTIRFTNIQENEKVFHRLLLLEGVAGNGDGSLTIHPDPKSGFQAITWEVNGTHFKALVPLTPGQNRLSLNFQSKLPSPPERAELTVTFEKPNSPPLHLAIVAAKDSPVWVKDGRRPPSIPPRPKQAASGDSAPPSRFISQALSRLHLDPRQGASSGSSESERAIVDAPPGRRRDRLRAGGLEEVKKRIAIQAYLWQAFHAEQMRRMGMSRRGFRLDDGHLDPAPGARFDGIRSLESLPTIHLLRSEHTLQEFRDPNNAQQNKDATNSGAMHAFAREALEAASTPRTLHSSPIAVLTLDTTYDPKLRLIRGHAALGAGGPDGLSHGVMGSHWLWAAPSSLDEVTSAFLDVERTDESCCANDLNECPTAWQTLNIGSGAWFHEAGHALNNPHWPSGLMARGYVEFNRAFMTREPACARNGLRSGFFAPIHSGNDSKHNHLHRAQAARARWHPCFRLPSDPALPYLERENDGESFKHWTQCNPSWTGTPTGSILMCAAGIGSLEVFVNGDYKTHIEWLNLPTPQQPSPLKPPTETFIDPTYLAGLVGFDVMSPLAPVVSVNAVGCNMRQAELEDYRRFGVAQPIMIPGIDPSRMVLRGIPVGQTNDCGWQFELIFAHEFDDAPHGRPRLVRIDIFSGAALDGLIFVYNDGSSDDFGPCGGSPYSMPIGPNDEISHFNVRAGAWIDAIEVVLKSGRTSGMRGNANGGSLKVLEAPKQGGKLIGLFGSSGDWMDSIGVWLSESRLAADLTAFSARNLEGASPAGYAFPRRMLPAANADVEVADEKIQT